MPVSSMAERPLHRLGDTSSILVQAAFLLANIDVKIQSVAFTATRYGSPGPATR